MVLCTKSKTHKIQKVETSNTMLLVPPIDGKGETEEHVVFRASGASTFQFETDIMAPRLDQLEALVALCPYGACGGDATGGARESLGHDTTSAARKGRLNFEELKARVQASEEEIRSALAVMHAIEVDGRWCSVDAEALNETFDAICGYVDSNPDDVHVDALSFSACTAALPDADPVLIRHCLNVFATANKEEERCDAADEKRNETGVVSATMKEADGKDGGIIALDWNKVAKHCAHKAFNWIRTYTHAGNMKPVPADELFDRWGIFMPGKWGCEAFEREKYEPLLGGIALKTGPKPTATELQNVPPNSFVYMPEKAMPTDPAERFEFLFDQKPKWTESELQPYLAPLECPGVTVASLRLKYTRMTVDSANKGAPPVFTLRNAK